MIATGFSVKRQHATSVNDRAPETDGLFEYFVIYS